MARTQKLLRSLTAAIRAPWSKRFPFLGTNINFIDYAWDNAFRLLQSNAADTADLELLTVDSNNLPHLFQEAISPQVQAFTFNITANGSIGQNNTFFIADKAYYVQAIQYVHKTAATTAGTVTATVTRDTGTTAPGQGLNLMSNTFNAKGSTNTVQSATLNGQVNLVTDATLVLAKGDRLALAFSTATLTSLAGVTVTVYLTPGCTNEIAPYFVHLNADISTQTFFVANRDFTVQAVYAIFGTAFAASTTLDVFHDTGTNAPGAGNSILSAAMAVDGTGSAINTVITPALTATTSRLTLNAGDRLSAKYSATTTGQDVCIVVVLQPLYKRKEVTWQLGPNGQQQVAQNFFIADRDYEVVDLSCTFATAAGGAAKLLVTIDKGTTAPGGGNAVHTDNASAGFDLNATINTVQVGTLNTLRNRMLSAGDRLGLSPTGAAQAIANVAITASLAPR
jgi:hypothetical protein